MTRGRQVPSEMEKCVHSRVCIEKSLRLPVQGETTHSSVPLWQQVCDVAVTKIEAKIEPNLVLDVIGWGTMAVICGGASIHLRILAHGQLTWQYRFRSR